DGDGGAWIVWEDRRNYTTFYTYMQHLSRKGQAWGAVNGERVCTQASHQTMPIIADGAVVLWQDHRNDNVDLYAQKYVFTAPACDIAVKYYKKLANRIIPADSTFMVSCPAGDQDSIKVYLDFNDADMVRDYEADEIIMEAQGYLQRFMFWGWPLYASGSVTSANGYETTISHANASAEPCAQSCQDPTSDDLKVRLIGYDVGWAEGIIVKSPDYTGDGNVNLLDLVYFGNTYGKSKGQEGFNTYFDFTGDDAVNLSDYAIFGTHYYHSKPASAPAPVSVPMEASNVVAVLAVGESEEDVVSKRLHVTLSLNAGKFAAVSLGLDNEYPGLQFLGWAQNPDLKGTSAAMQVRQNGRGVVFISAFDVHEAGNGGVIELGTLEFAATKEAAAAIAEKGFPVLYAEIAESETSIKSLRVETGKSESPTPVAMDLFGPCYPNPFNPTTTIDYAISRDSHVNLSVYSIDGRLIRTLVNEYQKGNRHNVQWDGKDDRGTAVASGIYFCRIKTERLNETMKLVLVR
ncbi:MAG: T9SS type A sorting domain-containing protein, partial [Candidatus Krumholzibacteria bacterium]|nr:T9SS type A sorting domain-containing protein [Candidatus Krumholzibacteria bacterium]